MKNKLIGVCLLGFVSWGVNASETVMGYAKYIDPVTDQDNSWVMITSPDDGVSIFTKCYGSDEYESALKLKPWVVVRLIGEDERKRVTLRFDKEVPWDSSKWVLHEEYLGLAPPYDPTWQRSNAIWESRQQWIANKLTTSSTLAVKLYHADSPNYSTTAVFDLKGTAKEYKKLPCYGALRRKN